MPTHEDDHPGRDGRETDGSAAGSAHEQEVVKLALSVLESRTFDPILPALAEGEDGLRRATDVLRTLAQLDLELMIQVVISTFAEGR